MWDAIIRNRSRIRKCVGEGVARIVDSGIKETAGRARGARSDAMAAGSPSPLDGIPLLNGNGRRGKAMIAAGGDID